MRFITPAGPIDAEIVHVTVAGWTGRDPAAVQHHIEELAAIGVAPPSQVPLYYKVASTLLATAATIQVLGPNTSGEIEPLILKMGGRFYLGLGSDQTDRALEAVSVAASKQVCAKPVSETVWPLEDVEDHVEMLELLTEIEEDGDWTVYQKGTLASIRPLSELIKAAGLSDDSALFCGTLSALGGVRPATSYRMSLHDPILDRAITLNYSVESLPIVT